MTRTLLPPGCYDLLPPFARQEAELTRSLLAGFEAFGYSQVAPPLLEYSDSLLAGRGASLSSQVFRLMDPGAHKVMGLRADHTMQIARIAATRLVNAPLPLRLSYSGPVLRAQGERGRGGRQLTQAGIELIGPASPEADAEVIRVGAEALLRAGIGAFVIDLNFAGVVGQLLSREALDADAASAIMNAVNHKDTCALDSYALTHGQALKHLVSLSGPAAQVLAAMKNMALPGAVAESLAALGTVAELLRACLPPGIAVTMDPTEARGFEYHTGVTFSFFAAGSLTELGRGGRYRIDTENLHREATGLTLYVNALQRLLPEPNHAKCVFIAGPLDRATLEALHADGFVTLLALPDYDDSREEAARLGCTHYFAGGSLDEL